MRITVHAKPNSDERKIKKMDDNLYKVWTKEPAKDNKANFDILNIIAEHFHIPASSVKLLGGRTSKNKVFKIQNEK